jgi:hypothetical protein
MALCNPYQSPQARVPRQIACSPSFFIPTALHPLRFPRSADAPRPPFLFIQQPAPSCTLTRPVDNIYKFSCDFYIQQEIIPHVVENQF